MSSRSNEETLSLEECWPPCGLTERLLFLGEEPPVKWCLKCLLLLNAPPSPHYSVVVAGEAVQSAGSAR